MNDRLAEIEERLRTARLSTTPWAKVPMNSGLFELLQMAPSDMDWLIAEVKRLRQELGTWQLIHTPTVTEICKHEWVERTGGLGTTTQRCTRCGMQYTYSDGDGITTTMSNGPHTIGHE